VSVELATAYVNIQASTKGLGKDITSTMGGAGTDGGQVAAKGFRQKFTGGLKGTPFLPNHAKQKNGPNAAQ